MKIIADENIPFLQGVLEPYAGVRYLPGDMITKDVVQDADALLIRTRTKCGKRLLGGTNVGFIGSATIGFDHIDTGFCDRENIFWTNAPGCNSSSVQQYVAAALLMVAHDYRLDLKKTTIGIVGVGNVGSKVEKLAAVLGCNVLLCDPPRARKESPEKFVDLSRIVKESDIVTLHVPLVRDGEDSTYHLFNRELFGMMKKGAWFFNTARGEVVKTDALKEALVSGWLDGAVVDVWEEEPYIDRDLMETVYIATPHVAGYSYDGKANGTAMVVNSLSDHFGLPLTGWYPDDIPEPGRPVIFFDGTSHNDEDIFREAVLHSYNIKEDDARLRRSPSLFEKYRSDYPLRREFTSYTLSLKGCRTDLIRRLRRAGFSIS